MLSTRRSGTEYPISLRSTTTTATKLLLASTLAVIALCIFAIPTYAQTPLPIGQISSITPSNNCTGGSWFSTASTTCDEAIVSCPNTVNTTVVFAYTIPAGLPNGVVMFFTGGDGTAAAGDATGSQAAPLTMPQTYFAAGFAIVQLAWGAAWEGTDQGQSGQLFPGNIQTAACRPATLINWVYNNVYLPIAQTPAAIQRRACAPKVLAPARPKSLIRWRTTGRTSGSTMSN
jgi:hypothetical protein